jgi:iron complex transport system substrate-binding protein
MNAEFIYYRGTGMKLLRLLAAIMIICIAGLTACSPMSTTATTATPTSATYIDDIGRTVQITSIPQRIVSLSPSNTEIVYALGLQDRLVGVTSYDNYPPDAKSKPVVSDYSTVDLEKIANAKPDLVLADSIQQHDTIPALEKLGITVYTMTPTNTDGILNEIKVLGGITGKTEEADNLVSSLTNRINAITDKTAQLTDSQKPRVLYVTWYDPIWTAGSDTMIQYLIDQAGGTNIASDLNGYATITLESVIQRNPQVILVMSSMGAQDASLAYIESNEQFKSTDALKNNQVYEVDADIFGRTTPRIIDGLETMAKDLHPELFK